MQRRGLLDETCPLEDSPQERYDAYGFGKLKQEELVREYGEKFGLPYVDFETGNVFGPGKPGLSGRVGIDTFGVFIQVGGSNLLPLTFVDNCAEAIVLAGLKPGVEGEVFNVVDDELLTSGQFLSAYKKSVRPFLSFEFPISPPTTSLGSGRNTPGNRRGSYRQYLTGVAVPRNGKKSVSAIRNFTIAWAGNQRWT